MREPYRSQLARMVRGGAASRDVHDDGHVRGFASAAGKADDAFVARELNRVALHQQSLLPLLEHHVHRARRILDFGCGTGGTTVALALSALGAEETLGIDANADAIAAAHVRAAGYDLAAPTLRFEHVVAGQPLQHADHSFDLVVMVSVMEFVPRAVDRDALAAELRRLVAPGGFLYIATPRPRLRAYHSGAILGDLRRSPGMPWSSPPRQVAAWGGGWSRIALTDQLAARVATRLPWLPPGVVAALGGALPLVSTWQKALWRRPR